MTLREKVLRKKAKKRELKELQKNKLVPERICELEELLHEVYVNQRPKQSDYQNRKDLVRVFNEIAKAIYGNCKDTPVVEEFGSFSMDIFSSKSDLDLSVNFSNNAAEFPQEKKIKTLRKFARKFYALKSKGHVSSIHPIMAAKVPILKVVDFGTKIECDLSVENRDGILKSRLVHMISSIDERFQKLSFLMKIWAKAHGINSSKDRTLNSLSIVLLVAFHLQTRDPPILPPFSAIFEDGTDPTMVVKFINKFLNYGKKNKESSAELFVTLLIKLSSVEALWPKGLCASTYLGSWTSKTWNFKAGCISVEDFADRSQNVARAVGTAQVKKINKCIQLSIQYVLAFMDCQIQGPRLREFLFGRDAVPTLVDTGTTNFEKPAQLHISLNPIGAKRMQPTDGWVGAQEVVSFDPILTKRMRAAEDWGTPTGSWGGMQTEGWGGTQQVLPLDPNLTMRIQSTEDWKGMPKGSWGGKPTAGWGVTQQVTPLDPILTEKTQFTKGWGGTPTGSWGGEATEGWGGMQQSPVVGGGMQKAISLDPILSKEKKSTAGWGGTLQANEKTRLTKGWGGAPTESWRGTATEGWGGTQQANEKTRLTKGWGGAPTESWGGTAKQSTLGCGEAKKAVSFDPIMSKEKKSAACWGRTQQLNEKKRFTKVWGGTSMGSWTATGGWGGMQQSSLGWGGMQKAISLDPILSKQKKSTAGWGGTQQANGHWRKRH